MSLLKNCNVSDSVQRIVQHQETVTFVVSKRALTHYSLIHISIFSISQRSETERNKNERFCMRSFSILCGS